MAAIAKNGALESFLGLPAHVLTAAESAVDSRGCRNRGDVGLCKRLGGIESSPEVKLDGSV